MIGGESRKDGTRLKSEADWLDNRYCYYDYRGNYKWKSYSHTSYFPHSLPDMNAIDANANNPIEEEDSYYDDDEIVEFNE